MDIVERLEKQPLSDADLKRMMGDTPVKIMVYDDLSKFSSMKAAMGGKKHCIILLRLKDTEVGHWILIIDYGDHFEHFDPYGLNVDEELSITHEKPVLKELLQNKSHNSPIRFQSKKEMVNTCGRWCIARALFSKMSLGDFHSFIDKVHPGEHDIAVTLLTMLL